MPVAAKGRSVRGEADATDLLAAVSASGLPLATWCGEHGVNAHSLYWWRSKMHDRDVHKSGGSQPLPRLVEVRVAAPPVAGPARYEVVLPNEVVVRVGADFDAEVLRRLVGAVRAC